MSIWLSIKIVITGEQAVVTGLTDDKRHGYSAN